MPAGSHARPFGSHFQTRGRRCKMTANSVSTTEKSVHEGSEVGFDDSQLG
jgi:hypothetical protein